MERNSKNDWVEKAMNSLDGLQRAEAGDALFDRIEQRLNGGAVVSLQNTIPKRRIYVAAASVLLLATLNLYAMLNKHHASNKDTEVKELAKYYGLTNDNWQDNL